jgi:hypothetical protein
VVEEWRVEVGEEGKLVAVAVAVAVEALLGAFVACRSQV